MEPARPPLELLPDLPVEEPLDATKAKGAAGLTAPAAAPAAAEAPAQSPPGTPPIEDSSPTGLNFVVPEMFLGPGENASAIPVVNPAADAKVPEPPAEPELEDPVVDEILSAPPPT